VIKSGEVMPTRPQIIDTDALNFASMFKFLLPTNVLEGIPKFLDLTSKAAPISHNVANFHGDG